MSCAHGGSSKLLPVIEYSSDDVRSRYSSETAQDELRVSKEIWAAYLFSAADDLEFYDDTDEMRQKDCRQIAISTDLDHSAWRIGSIYRRCKAKLQDFAKGIQYITKSRSRKLVASHLCNSR